MGKSPMYGCMGKYMYGLRRGYVRPTAMPKPHSFWIQLTLRQMLVEELVGVGAIFFCGWGGGQIKIKN